MPRRPRRTHGRLRRLTAADRARKLARNGRRERPDYGDDLVPTSPRSMQRASISRRDTTAATTRATSAAVSPIAPLRAALAFVGSKRRPANRDARLARRHEREARAA